MDTTELRAWLELHCMDVFAFMDYEPTLSSDDALAGTMDAWFGTDAWRATGHRFVDLGTEGSGSLFAAWIRPGAVEPFPVVLLGSEGGRGVLASSPARWAQLVAHAPLIDDCHEPASAVVRSDEELDEAFQRAAGRDPRASLRAYRDACAARFGPLPTRDDLTGGLDALNGELLAWVAAQIASPS